MNAALHDEALYLTHMKTWYGNVLGPAGRTNGLYSKSYYWPTLLNVVLSSSRINDGITTLAYW